MTVRAALLSNFFGTYLVRGLVSEVSYMYHGFPPLKIHLLLTKKYSTYREVDELS